MNRDIEPSTLTGKVLLQGINALKKTDGRTLTSKYPETPEGLRNFQEKSIQYLESVLRSCEESEDLRDTPYPNIESWCAFLNISRATLQYYTRRGEEWQEAIMQIKTVIVSAKSQLADHGKIPPMTWVFDAANNFGYRNTSEFKLVDETNEKKEALTAAELPQLGVISENTAEKLPVFNETCVNTCVDD